MPSSVSRTNPLLAGDALRAELGEILRANPSLVELLHPQVDEPDLPTFELLCSGQSPYYVVKVPIRGRPGTVWASRLPGIRPSYTGEEVDALERFGIDRVVCLVPSEAIERLHGAHRYLAKVSQVFPGHFHQVEIVDHEVPGDDRRFEDTVALVDEALGSGEQVLVHCVGGCGRTGMFVASLMIKAGLSPIDAIREFRRRRRCGPETPEQLAYVLRYARRLHGGTDRRKGRYRRDEVSLRVSVQPDGSPCKIAQGGIAAVYAGRLAFPGGGTRRVAVKRFAYPVDDDAATKMARAIEALLESGVRLPPMFLYRLDGVWVQVSPLFGSLRRGSKLHQPGRFYRQAASDEIRFATDQLTRVANAGYRPSLDLFVLFRDGTGRLLPIDLDLIEPAAVPECASGLLKALFQLGSRAQERDDLLALARSRADSAVLAALDGLMNAERSPFRALWALE